MTQIDHPVPPPKTMATSRTSKPWIYDVFMSFRNADTQANFTDRLHTELEDAGIKVYEHDNQLTGEEIRIKLLQAIQKSRISVIVFTKRYVDSKWCLEELTKIMECKRTDGQKVLPVFYDVDPSDVQRQDGSYAQALLKHQNHLRKDLGKVQRWRRALTEAANLFAFDLGDYGYETKLVKNIKQEITMNLSRSVPNSPVQKRPRDRLEDVKYYNLKLHDMAIKMLQLFHQPTEATEPEKRSVKKMKKKGTPVMFTSRNESDIPSSKTQKHQEFESAESRVASSHDCDNSRILEDSNVDPEQVEKSSSVDDSTEIEHLKIPFKSLARLKYLKEVSFGSLEQNAAGHLVQVANEDNKSLQTTLYLYCSLFPKGYEFRKYDLVQLWIAEGFIKEREGEQIEDTGVSYFKSLEDEGFFVRSRYDFRVDFESVFSESFTPNSLYKINTDKVVVVSKNTIYRAHYFRAVDAKSGGVPTTTQHLSLICEGIDDMTFGEVEKLKQLHSLLLLTDNGCSITHVPRNLFWSLNLFRTLNLSGTLISELPSSIRNVKELRYLDVSDTPITRLPESIASLHNLQTLKLRGCVHFDQLPEGMNKLTNLRHIELDIMRQLDSLPPHLGKLTNLQTLSAFLVGTKVGCRIVELQNLKNLRGGICLSRLENVSSVEEAKEAALINKKDLHRLELRWSYLEADDIKKKQLEEILECLEPYCGLKELHIQYYGGSKLPAWISKPYFADLVAITLYRCKNCILLPSIGQLPALKVLSITEMNEVKEINNQFFRDGLNDDQVVHAFPKLERLEVDIMLKLKEWKEVKNGDLPSLLKLTVDSCPELVTLPSFSSLNSLKYLEIRRCPKLLASDELPVSLESLIIIDSPQTKEWFRKGDGKEIEESAINDIIEQEPLPQLQRRHSYPLYVKTTINDQHSKRNLKHIFI